MVFQSADQASFNKAFQRFLDLVENESGKPFRTFDDGLAAAWESYKPKLRKLALSHLSFETWSADKIGDGEILKNSIAAIEIQEGKGGLTNNLVFWPNRYGHATRDHHMMLEGLTDKHLCLNLERTLFSLYHDTDDEGLVFTRLQDLLGSKYPALAYLFFLKDQNRFMPIRPTHFDRAFREIGIDLVTTRHCTWENYSNFNEALKSLCLLIENATSISRVSLIDAHSFCWILSSLLKNENAQNKKRQKTRKSSGLVYSAREKAIVEMRQSIEKTVAQSNGQSIWKTIKNKSTSLNAIEIEKLISEKLNLQEDRCNLTGIEFEFDSKSSNPNLRPSVDRIDSNGDYEPKNVQIVCRFINFWKSDRDNSEFIELLNLVRGGDEM